MKKIILLVATSIVIALGALFLLVDRSESKLSEAEIREKFRCDRFTTDELATDIYCQNPDYYYEDAKNGIVIDSGDFEDPRYRAMYED